MNRTHALTASLSIALFVVTGCSPAADDAEFSPANSYRQYQLDQALEGVSVVDGRIVAAPAPRLDDDAVAALIAEVDVHLDGGMRSAAIEKAVAAVRGAPHGAETYLALGRALLTSRRTEVAVAALASATDCEPRHVEAAFLYGVALDRVGRRDEALTVWQNVVAMDPDHGEAHARLAAVSVLRSDSGAAAEHLSAARSLGAPVPGQLAAIIATGKPAAATVTTGHSAGGTPEAGSSVVVGPQVQLNPTLGSQRANETSAAAGAPGEVVAGWNEYPPAGGVVTGVAVSLDGESWTDQVVRAPVANQSGTEGDPMTASDPRTGTVWVGAISFDSNGGVFVARKQPGVASFEPSVLTLASGAADKGWMAAGPRPGLPDTTRLYVAYNHGLQYSDDLGDTWSSPVSLGSGVGFLPRVGPDGTLYVSYWDYGYGHWLRRSTDGGQTVSARIRIATIMETWEIQTSPQIPGDFRVPPMASLAVDPNDGTLFCVYMDTSGVVGGNTDVDVYLTKSDDGGDTWDSPVVVTADPVPPGDQFFPWLEVTPSGRLHLLYLDSSATIQDDSASNAWLDAAYQWSDDEGSSWTTHRLTGSSFDTALTDLGNGQFIGDYTGTAVVGERVWPVYLATEHGVAGVYSHAITGEGPVFADDFESGGTDNWSRVLP